MTNSRAEYYKKWRQENREKISEYNQLNKEKKAEYNKEYNQLNKERRAEYFRKYQELNKKDISKYREKNKEKKAEYDRKYREENREYNNKCKREYCKKRKELCLEYLGGKCVKCGTTHNLQFDHIKREGKKYTITEKLSIKFDNLKEELNKCQLLCAPCHLDKTAKEWVDMYN